MEERPRVETPRRASPAMDVVEIFRRVGVAYWPLIVILTAVGVAAPAAYHFNDQPIYTSTVRFVVDATDPQITTQSTALADTVRAIATSPSHVAGALDTAGVTRDATTFAERNIRVEALGSSGVMQLEVKDVSRIAAAKIANALALDVISTRSTISRGEATEMVTSLTAQINQLDTRIAAIDAQTSHFRTLPADQLTGLYGERATLAQERLTLESQRNQINQTLALRPQGGIIDDAQPANESDPSRAPMDMALGFLGGLVFAVLCAALLAVFRPRISGRFELGQALGGLVLGDTREWDSTEGPSVSTRILLAARRLGVTRLHVASVESSPEAQSTAKLVAERLALELLGGATGAVDAQSDGRSGRPGRRRLVVKPLDLNLSVKNGDATQTGLLLVAPTTVGKKNLESEADLVALTGWPVAGIVTYGDAAANPSPATPLTHLRRRIRWRSR